MEKVPLNRINQTQWGSATCHIVGDTLGWGKRESQNKTTKESMVNLQEIKCDLFFKIKNKDRSTWPKHLSSGVCCMLYVVVSDRNFVTSFKRSRNILALSANKIELNSSKTDSKLSLTHSFSHMCLPNLHYACLSICHTVAHGCLQPVSVLHQRGVIQSCQLPIVGAF